VWGGRQSNPVAGEAIFGWSVSVRAMNDRYGGRSHFAGFRIRSGMTVKRTSLLIPSVMIVSQVAAELTVKSTYADD